MRLHRVDMAGLVGKIPAIPTLGAQGVTLRNVVYDMVMKRTSTYVGAIFVCAMVAENTLDTVVDTAWNVNNKGVRRHPPVARSLLALACVALLNLGLSWVYAQKFFTDIPFATIAANADADDY